MIRMINRELFLWLYWNFFSHFFLCASLFFRPLVASEWYWEFMDCDWYWFDFIFMSTFFCVLKLWRLKWLVSASLCVIFNGLSTDMKLYCIMRSAKVINYTKSDCFRSRLWKWDGQNMVKADVSKNNGFIFQNFCFASFSIYAFRGPFIHDAQSFVKHIRIFF